uniref:Uncharacterized protein n=1 Tax=Pithovirus LCPAC406 TaxID=2506599 RepID=A0A481ZDC5_9VIRU|nr:MAG: uncharacterized protein LCPAC406_02770 [Pithovirus LCPAC406]
MSNEFTFKVLTEEGEEYSHIGLTSEGFDSDVRNMLNKDEILIRGNKITVAVSYPLNDQYEFDIILNRESNFTRFALVKVISQLYQLIYREEKETAKLLIESMAERFKRTGSGHPLGMNKALSCGKYGIWGHDLGDLVLNTVYYDSDKDLYTLAISS